MPVGMWTMLRHPTVYQYFPPYAPGLCRHHEAVPSYATLPPASGSALAVALQSGRAGGVQDVAAGSSHRGLTALTLDARMHAFIISADASFGLYVLGDSLTLLDGREGWVNATAAMPGFIFAKTFSRRVIHNYF